MKWVICQCFGTRAVDEHDPELVRGAGYDLVRLAQEASVVRALEQEVGRYWALVQQWKVDFRYEPYDRGSEIDYVRFVEACEQVYHSLVKAV